MPPMSQRCELLKASWLGICPLFSESILPLTLSFVYLLICLYNTQALQLVYPYLVLPRLSQDQVSLILKKPVPFAATLLSAVRMHST